MKISNLQKGFTLIELLTGLVVLGVVGTIVSGIVVSSLRGSAKTNTVTVVKQNGDYAISVMGRMIRNASVFNGMSTDGINYSITCSFPVGVTTPTPTPVQYSYIKITSPDGNQTVFSCPPVPSPTPQTIASSSATSQSIIDTNAVSVVPSSCYFTCSQDSLGNFTTIGISFSLSQKNAGFLENNATVPFQTSISLRNLNL